MGDSKVHHFGKASPPFRNLQGLLIILLTFAGANSLEAQNYIGTYNSTGGNPPGAFNTETDVNTTGTEVLPASLITNQWSTAQPIPFSFNFFGSPVTHFKVSGNGLVSFDTTAATGVPPSPNAALPSASLPDKTIAAYWDDFTGSPPTGTNDRAYTKLLGTAPNRQLVIKWFSYEWGPGGDFAYIAVILEEGTDKIYIVEQYTSSALSSTATTVGVQVDAGTAFTAGSNIALNGLGTSNSDNLFYEYEFFPAGACLPPSNFSAGNITSSSVDLSWTSGGASNWEVEYGAPAFTPGSGTRVVTSTNPYTLSGLSPNTSYDIYIRDSCGVGDVSSWAGPLNITTLCASQLSGAYTINAGAPTSGTNFNSFADAANELNMCGISGAVTFNIAAGTYTDSLHLMDINGASSTNTITFDGSDSALVTLTYSSGNSMPTVFLQGADYVTLRNMTIANTSTSDGWGVLLQNAANNNTVDMCHVKMPVTTTTDIIGVVASASLTFETSTGDNANSFTLSNSLLTGGETGVHLTGGSSSVDHNTGNTIMNNVFRNQDDHGIEVDGQTGLLVTGNDVDALVNSQADAIYLVDMDDFEVSANQVVSPDYGIYINDGNDGITQLTNSRVINNMVVSASDYGLYLNDIEYVEVYHNTIVGEPAILVNDQANALIIKNNIFYSTADYALEFTDTLNPTDAIDYNVYYTGGTDAFEILTTIYTDLPAWQAGNPGLNGSSLEGDPQFLSFPTNLHLVGTLANDAGDGSVGIMVDIDGEARSATNPDIGADEYAPPSCGPSSNVMAINITSTSADLSWTAGDGSSFNIEYGPTGYTQGAGTLVSGVSNPHTLTGLSPQTGYDFYVQDDCGGSTSPWVGPVSFTTLCAPLNVFPWVEDFETSQSSIPNCWENETNDDADWIFRSGSIGHGATTDNTTGTSSGYYAGMDDSQSSANDTVNNLLTPSFDLTGLTTPRLNFYYFIGNDATLTSKLIIDVYDGISWNMDVSTITFTQAAWLQHVVDLTPYASANTRVRFRGIETTDFNSDVSIDDVTVEETPSCAAPLMLGATNITHNSADIYWTPGGASNWNVEYGPTGFTQGAGAMLNASNDTISLTGLSSFTTYQFYVRDSCGPGDVSSWTGPVSFTTLIQGPTGVTCATGSPTFVITEEFDGSTSFTGDISTSSGDWNFDDNTTSSSNTGPSGPQSGTHYIYFEASAAGPATMISPEIDLTSAVNAAELSFWLHAYGSDIGYLHVTASNSAVGPFTDTLFSLIGELQTASSDPWQPVGIDVSSYMGQKLYLNFTADRSGSFEGDIAIDLLRVETCGSFCLPPGGLGATNITASSADIYFTPSGASSTDFNVEYGLSGFTLGTGTIINATNDTTTITGLSATTTYDFYVRDSCGVGDVSSWVGPFSFTTACNSFVAPFIEDFESSSPSLTCWSNEYVADTKDWTIGTGSSGGTISAAHMGSQNAVFVSSSGGPDTTRFVSPIIDITGLSSPELRFWYGQEEWFGDQNTLGVYYRTSATGNWTLLWTDTTNQPAWVEAVISLPNSSATYQIAFEGVNNFGRANVLDDVSVAEAPGCFAPTSLGSTNLSATSADIYWTTGGAMDWQVEYGPTGFSQGAGIMMNASNDTLTLSGLSANTSYDFYVRDSCGAGAVSPWAGPATFTTPCPAPDRVSLNESICQGDSILLEGAYQTVAGTYRDTLLNSIGCDSIVTTNLQVLPNKLVNKSDTICQGDSVLIAGVYRSTAGVYNEVFTAANGCDSISATQLFVLPTYQAITNASICQGDSIMLGGAYQSTAGTYTDVYTAANGCDSTVSTLLTVNPVDTTQLTATTSDPNGVGVFTTTLTNQFGCDSLVITTVTFSPDPCADPDSTFINRISCDNAQAGVTYQTFTGSDGCDSVLVTTTVFDPGSTTQLPAVAICQGQSALIFGNPENTANTYYDTLPNQNGCDSILVQALIVNPVDTTQQTATTSDPNAVGVFTNILTNQFGCDSVVITTVTFSPDPCANPDSTFINRISCDNAQAGVTYQTFTGSDGCDSVLVTTTVFDPGSITQLPVVEICQGQSAMIFGNLENMAGTYYDTLANQNGCDSILTITLNVLTPTSGAVSVSICDGESILLGGALRTTAGVYVDTLTGSNGCDSVLTTTLSIKPTYSVMVTDSICPGDSLFVGGAYQTTAGTYTDILGAANGCDSVVVTSLILRTDSGCVQDTAMQACLTVVSDGSWMQSSVTSPVNLSGYWPGASGLPGVGTYNLPVNIGQPYGYPSINQIEGTDVISTTHSVTYFRKEFSLTKSSDLDVRLLITVDDQADIYLNGHRVALITRFGRPNYKFPAHDLKYFSNGTEINGFLGGDMYDMTSTADMDTLLNDGVNELVLAVRNLGKSSDRGGFSFRMDINCADNIITQKSAEMNAEITNGLFIFPNPVGELLTIHSELAISSVRVFDLTGKLLSSYTYDTAKEVVIEMGHLSKGVYVIEVNEMGYEVSTVKIVKM